MQLGVGMPTSSPRREKPCGSAYAVTADVATGGGVAGGWERVAGWGREKTIGRCVGRGGMERGSSAIHLHQLATANSLFAAAPPVLSPTSPCLCLELPRRRWIQPIQHTYTRGEPPGIRCAWIVQPRKANPARVSPRRATRKPLRLDLAAHAPGWSNPAGPIQHT